MIAVIGDIMLDKYIYGSSTRKSPECISAPVVKEYSTESFIGGAGNTALNIKNLGANTTLFCALHKNSELTNLLNKEKLNYLSISNYSNDVVKTRIYSNGQYLARLDYDYVVDCSENALLEAVFSSNPSLLVISDYAKGTIENPVNFINKANELGIKCLVDPKKNLEEYKGAYILKPNLKEFCEWADIPMSKCEAETLNKLSLNLLKEAVQTLAVDNLLITLGANGSILVTASGEVKKIDALNVNVVDVTGAGDSFIAAIAVAINEKNSLTKAIDFATKVAGIAVTKKGTSYVKRNEI
jgi:D-beta-D-heptose 7-phosphate kinase/D-beta-D-heptose 1-phosphate adenosyltransferase